MLRGRPFFVALALIGFADLTAAGTTYKVTSSNGTDTIEYRVNFGGARRFERFTAFDPASKKFVYLDWDRGQPAPEPVSAIWDHRTGETIQLFKFPEVDQPLPVIPSIEEMKRCPLTGDENFEARPLLAYD